jgi:large subunit ribosomal protein L22
VALRHEQPRHVAAEGVLLLRVGDRRAQHLRDIAKILRSAIANAQQKDGFSGDVDRLYVSACFANQGPSQKRVRPAPMGRAFRVLKRTAHLTVQVAERAEKVVAVGKATGDDNRPKRPQRQKGQPRADVRAKAEGAGRKSAKKAKE